MSRGTYIFLMNILIEGRAYLVKGKRGGFIMADTVLTNSAVITGLYNGVSTEVNTPEVNTNLIRGLTAWKEADLENWVNGPLTYTITVTNNAEAGLEKPILSDILDTDLVTLIANTVKVNGETAEYNFDDLTGILTINLETLGKLNTAVITFQVSQV